ncbi:hypothetical protein C8R43DRAFT_1116170 [Mycena crocata]|nr:hypothetical protein C8R43DRAFT_1116170 [Mycena crocata]
MHLISVLHVSTALLWATFAAPVQPLPSLNSVRDKSSVKVSHSVHTMSVASDIFETISLPSASHVPVPVEATHDSELNAPLQLEQKGKGKKGLFQNGCLIA